MSRRTSPPQDDLDRRAASIHRLSIRSNTPRGTVVVLDFPPARTVRAAAA